MITAQQLITAHAVYSINVQWCNPAPFYVGSCPLDRLHKLSDARRNSEWQRLIDPDKDVLTVTLIAIVPDAAQAARLAAAHATDSGAWANRAAPPPEPLKRRVRCLETGAIHENAAAAARAAGITRQAVAQFIKSGRKYERCE